MLLRSKERSTPKLSTKETSAAKTPTIAMVPGSFSGAQTSSFVNREEVDVSMPDLPRTTGRE